MTAMQAPVARAQYYATLALRRLDRSIRWPATPRSRRLIDELHLRLKGIGPAAGGADRFWEAKRAEFRRQLLAHDPRRFASLPAVAETMFVDYPPYIARELERLQASADWATRWRPALREPRGLPLPRCPYYPRSSGNRIHHAHHLLAWETFAGIRIGELASVLEFGGGYGGMASLAMALAFRGRYGIYDLPELGALQEFFLRSNELRVDDGAAPVGVACLADDAALERWARPDSPDLFIATWSLSEAPLELRRELLGRIKPRYWLLAYQETFQSYDNRAFFREWSDRNASWRWQTIAADLIPGRHYYLFGAPR